MNVRKRGLALLMCICMIFTLLPFSALADATAQDVVYGKYDSTGTTWTKDNSLTAENDAYKNDKTGANIKYSKEAKPVAGEADTYDITLKIESTTTKTSPGASAVVLVIDQSYSMNCCATCNNDEHNYNFVYQHAVGCKTGHTGKVNYEDTRLKAAKDAAKQFADNYAATGSERYLSVVSFCEYSKYLNFGNYFNVIYWVDVSNEKDLKTFKDKIDTIKLDSGTNLSAGLDKAYYLFNNDTVKNISSRYTVVLTDGKPNYPDNSAKAAEDSADNLKTKAKSEVYTVCVGAEDTPFNGTTVGEFLKEKIASKKTGKVYAYNIITKEQLFAAFTAIFADIQLGLSSGFTVNDPMGANIVLQSQSITDAVIDNNGFVWTPTTPSEIVAGENGAKTYIYTVTYRVTLGEVPEDGTYPLNEDTTLKFKDGNKADGSDNNVTLQFNVPGVYREAPKYTVTYAKGEHGNLEGQDNSGNVVYPNLKKGALTPDAPKVNAADGYYFTGWDKEIAATVTADAVYTAQYEKKNEITVVANSDEVTYDGEVHSVSGFKTLSFTVEGNTYSVSGLDASVSGTDANTYTNAVTGTAVVTDAAGNDVTNQFTVNTQDGTLTIKQAEVTITADNKEKFVDEADPQFTYIISGIVEADKDKKVTLTIIREKGGTPEGEQAGSYNIIPQDASIEGSNNYTFKYVNGTLTIKERKAITVTLTAKKLLDGDLAKDAFTFALKDKDQEIIQTKNNNENGIVTFDALTFSSKGTYTYYMHEVAGGDQYIKYDDTVYKIVITVDKGADGNYEVKSQTYTVVSESDEAVPLDSIIFNNTTKTGSLIISKVVAGNAADKNKEFTFTLTLSENGEIMPGEVKYGGFTFKDGKYTFKLKNGGDEIFTGLPVGTTYTITESDNSGYTVSAEVSTTGGYEPMKVTDNAVSGTIIEHNTDVKFTNTKNSTPVNPGIGDEITVEITGNSDSVVYDGTEHSVKGYTVKISDPRYTEADFTFTGKAEARGINAGTYEMGLKAEQFKNTNARFTNVKFVIKADGVLTITPKELTITAGSKTEYGPTPVTCDEWTVSGLVAGDKVESVKITGIQSVPGSSPNVPSDAVIKNAKGEDVTKNYAIKYVNGTLTMLEVLNKEDHFNYIIGTPEGLSLPTANVTRAEVATIFFRLMTDDARAKFDSLDNNFSDVAKGMWYNRAISTLANAGIIKGDPAGTYRPDDPITRAEMAAIIARFGDFKEGGKTFNDISGHWAQKYIELAASNGWINGNPDGTFKPNNNITRAETVAMINRVLDRQTKDVSDLLPVSQMTNWSDNMDTAKWYYRDMQEATNNHKAERVGNSMYEKWTEKLPDIDWASYQI